MILYQIGGLSFEPFKFDLVDHERETGGDFAAKDVVGAQRPREPVGEADETITFNALMFPFHFGGGDALAILESMRVSQAPQPVQSGSGMYLGFYVIEKVRTRHTEISRIGTGKKIECTVTITKDPSPDVGDMLSALDAITLF